MAVVQFVVATGAFVAERRGYSRPGAALTPAQRLNYAKHYPNCPSELVGIGTRGGHGRGVLIVDGVKTVYDYTGSDVEVTL